MTGRPSNEQRAGRIAFGRQRHAQKQLRSSFVFVSPNGEELAHIGALIDAGKVQIPHLMVKSVKDAAAALDENQNRHVRGKVALKIDL